jgi:hypothetical protein
MCPSLKLKRSGISLGALLIGLYVFSGCPAGKDRPAPQSPKPRHPGVYLTPADIERAKTNITRFAWAKAVFDRIIQEADAWAAKDDAWLLAQVPPKGACFAYGFTGCPVCGASWGIWDKARASFENPGHVTCDNGHVLPDADHPDQGQGYTGPDGRIHYFVGSYNAWVIEKLTLAAAENLAYAYSLTGNDKYAAKAALILDAVAAIYPSCDKGSWDYPSDPPSGRLDRPWYQVSRVLVHLVDQYDQIYHSPALDAPSVEPGLTRRRNIEDNMLKNGAAYCYEHSLEGPLHNGAADYIRGALAAGLCLGIPEYIRWAVDGPFGIHSLLENNVGRDGQYYETSALYADHARNLYVTFAEPLLNCRQDPYPAGLDLYQIPRFRALMSLLNISLMCAGHRPSFGDTAPDISRIDDPARPFEKSDFMALERLFARSKTEEERKTPAFLLDHLAAGQADRMRAEAQDPVWLLFHAGAVPPSQTPLPAEQRRRLEGSHFLGQKGIAILRPDGRSEQAVLLRFGPSLNHGHLDDLNFNYFARGFELTYDLGYDLGSTHTQVGWSRQTASHNLVVVDESSQQGMTGGSLHLFTAFPGLKVMEASSENSYKDAGIRLYRRTMALVDAGNPYLLDIFRVSGGRRHDYVSHFLGSLTDVKGVGLGQEEKGSLAGTDIAWGLRQLNDGDMEGYPNRPYWNPPPGNGYGFLVRPKRGRTEGGWSAEWTVDNGARIRLLMAGQPETEVIQAEAPGISPKYPRAGYIIARRNGRDLASRYAAVIEAYAQRPGVESIERLPIKEEEHDSAAEALLITHADGTKDYVYSSLDGEPRNVAGLTFAGRFIFARSVADRLVRLCFTGAREFSGLGRKVRAEAAGWEGTVTEVDAGSQSVFTDSPLPEGQQLEGALVNFSNPGYSRAAAYRIARVRKAGGKTLLVLDEPFVLGKGEVTEVEGGTAIISRIPHEYARSVTRKDSGFFQGKMIRSDSGAVTRIIRTVPGANLRLEVEDAALFQKGEAFRYCDIQAGDRWHIDSFGCLDFDAAGDYQFSGTAVLEIRRADEKETLGPGK